MNDPNPYEPPADEPQPRQTTNEIRLRVYPFKIERRGGDMFRGYEGVNHALAMTLLRSGRFEWPIRMCISKIEGTRLIADTGKEIGPNDYGTESIFIPSVLSFKIEDESKLTLIEGEFFLEAPGPVAK